MGAHAFHTCRSSASFGILAASKPKLHKNELYNATMTLKSYFAMLTGMITFGPKTHPTRLKTHLQNAGHKLYAFWKRGHNKTARPEREGKSQIALRINWGAFERLLSPLAATTNAPQAQGSVSRTPMGREGAKLQNDQLNAS